MRDRVYVILLFVTIMLAMSIVCSCGSSKSSSKQNVVAEDSFSRQRKDSSATDKEVVIVENQESIENVEEVTTEYDTDKPMNPETGKYPVKKETVKKASKGGSSVKQTEYVTKNIFTEAEEVMVNKKETVIIEQNKQKSETRIFKQVKVLILSLLLLVIPIIGRLIYKKQNLFK